MIKITEKLLNRFNSKYVLNPETGCWDWIASKRSTSYGGFRVDGQMLLAHRVSYELFKGEIPNGLECCHTCDRPICINPDHLFLGSQSDNMKDKALKGRSNRGADRWSAKLTEEQVKIIKSTPKVRGSGRALAAKFNVSDTQISRIRNHKLWTYLDTIKL